jgi:hypothetical protein
MVAGQLSPQSISRGASGMTQYDTLRHAAQMGSAPWTQTVTELSDFHVAVFRDLFPVTRGHLLFVPRFNTAGVIRDCFDSAMAEGYCCWTNSDVSACAFDSQAYRRLYRSCGRSTRRDPWSSQLSFRRLSVAGISNDQAVLVSLPLYKLCHLCYNHIGEK